MVSGPSSCETCMRAIFRGDRGVLACWGPPTQLRFPVNQVVCSQIARPGVGMTVLLVALLRAVETG